MKRILGLLGWLGVVLVLAAVALRFIRPELQQWYQGLALAGLVVTALYALSQWRDIGRSFQGRSVRYGSMTAGSVVLFLGILVGINWISSRQNKRWDLTAAKQFSLSDQTKKILGDLTKPIVMRVFHDSGAAQQYRDQLAGYAYQSKNVSIEYIDAVARPTQAQQYNIQTLPTIVIEYDGRTERASAADEQTITNALKKVIEGKAKKAYVIQGHGEHDPTGSDPSGYSGVSDALKNDNFDVEKLTLAQTGAIPADATVVIVAGPKTDYFPAEVEAIKTFLKGGGKLLLMIDPPDKADAAQPASLIALAHDWGVDVGNNMVVDASGLGQLIGTDASVPIAMPAPHPITDQFKLMTAFPITRSVTPVTGGVDGHVAQKLLETSPQSWAESDIKSLYATGRPERNFDKGDIAGPITIAAAVSAPATGGSTPAGADLPKPETRVVIVGDSDFASNRALNIQGNRDLVLNMTNWLAQQENMIAIRPRDPENRGITLTEDQSQRIFWLTIFIIPGLLFANAVRVWWRRR